MVINEGTSNIIFDMVVEIKIVPNVFACDHVIKTTNINNIGLGFGYTNIDWYNFYFCHIQNSLIKMIVYNQIK